ncbi:hypothetical protein ACINWC323_1408 [Acinetobacter sp. WC-323]|nr:hypothetical protein ACINWC323_1408 [Acinetobacter sp. WC-323]
MSAFLIIIGFILALSGMIFGPHLFAKHITNIQEAKAMSFLCMLPGVLSLAIGFYLRQVLKTSCSCIYKIKVKVKP